MSFLAMELRAGRRKRLRLEELASLVTEDRISNLPPHLVHEIISYLPTRAATRLSVLSKKWWYFIETLSHINFNIDEFRSVLGRYSKLKIDQFMQKYLSLRNPNVIHRVKFVSHSASHVDIHNHFGRCLNLANHGRIQELDFKFWHNHGSVICYCFLLPSKFFKSQINLAVLKLEGCRIWKSQFVGFPILKVLSIAHSHINDNILSRMVHVCPRLESLTLECCYLLKKICVTSHTLKMLVVKHCPHLVSFYIDLPSLHTLECDASFDTSARIPVLEFEAPEGAVLEHLETLFLLYLTLENSTLRNIFSIFPNLNDLRMKHCHIRNGPQGASGNPKKFTLVDMYFPELIESFASSLEFLHCESNAHCWGATSYVPSCQVMYNCLLTLSLGGFFILSDETFEFLLSCCPRLENLTLRDCLSLRRLKVASQILKTLTIMVKPHRERLQIEAAIIEAPNLVYFDYDGPIIEFSHVIISHRLVCQLHFREKLWLGFGCQNDQLVLALRDAVYKFDVASRLTLEITSPEWFLRSEKGNNVPIGYVWGNVHVKTNKAHVSYSEVQFLLSISTCCTELFLELQSASILLKFGDSSKFHNLNLHLNPLHDCIRDHLVEVIYEIIEGGLHEMSLAVSLRCKAENLKLMSIVEKKIEPEVGQTSGCSSVTREIKRPRRLQ